ncbi:hypothetical protein [Micromonospora sp. S-DT3-3-22]|uniref:hypothetical protein n=1 Tax=Micromonospora sp. S-DT3-3-22 TaxID=2755359 RepID=UPI00188E832D|nr:hypothetical protein [Micromonospora sp. S-DT3-3-22]
MAISTCSTCGTSNWRSMSVDETGALGVCANGHTNFDASTTSSGGIRTGAIKVTGQSAIGSGAVAIGSTGDSKKDKKKKGK